VYRSRRVSNKGFVVVHLHVPCVSEIVVIKNDVNNSSRRDAMPCFLRVRITPITHFPTRGSIHDVKIFLAHGESVINAIHPLDSAVGLAIWLSCYMVRCHGQ
jgi:hypothetical protein